MAKLRLVKVVLSTGKTVYLREMRVSDTEDAAMDVAGRAGENVNVLGLLMQKSLVKLLLVKIADNEQQEPRTVTGNEREDMNSLFSVGEYGQVCKVIGKMSGADEKSGKEPKLELIDSE